jgi:hypothetical protein
VVELEARQLGGRRHQIVRQRGGLQLARVVVDVVLEERAGDALRYGPGDLALNNDGVVDAAGVFHADEALQRH